MSDAVQRQEIVLHGHHVRYRVGGEGPVLVPSGGLGRAVSPFLLAVTLPLSELVLPIVASKPVLDVGSALHGAVGRIGLQASADLGEIARGIASLHDLAARKAFVHTARS